MFHFRPLYVVGALTGVMLTFGAPDLAAAGPMSFPGAGAVTSNTSAIVEVRHYRRYSPAPAIAFGLFGALLGSAIANSEYDNYNNYDYYGYGGPSYSSGPGYVGGWNGAGHRGGYYGGHHGGYYGGGHRRFIEGHRH